ncbi:hypothetical protein [Actinoplanes auranticolor]|uniref:Uncharacterized protein n=1 Tax=Actinoplanes auranticolor TaxID=47988 RepID=A0A919SJU3_9ACTN|nr:hypothetical protein [Actinoplanes auranticolor]GIM73351.1 hypothetical protein Aau02nite_55600 [Actinoplanes auranticolor]
MRSLPGSPIDRLLTASLLLGPVLYLVADALYATRGWDDPAAAVVHVLGAVGYAFVLLRVVTWSSGVTAAVLLAVGVLGVAGNVAYGFNTIHVSLGDTDLVDATGAAALIKPLGLCFPLTLLLAAFALRHVQPLWVVAVLAVAGMAWPVAHIANVAWLAVLVNAALVGAFGAMAWAATRRTPAAAHPVTRPA